MNKYRAAPGEKINLSDWDPNDKSKFMEINSKHKSDSRNLTMSWKLFKNFSTQNTKIESW